MVVMLHKGIMAFSLGLNLAQAHGMTVKYFITASLIFSLASPTGMAVGIVISDLKDSLSKDVTGAKSQTHASAIMGSTNSKRKAKAQQLTHPTEKSTSSAAVATMSQSQPLGMNRKRLF